VNLPARVIESVNDTLRIRYLSQSDRRDPGTNRKIWSYEDEIYDITDESITEYMYDEGDLGFVSIGENDYIKTEISEDDEDDSDYEPMTETESDTDGSDTDGDDDGSAGDDCYDDDDYQGD
jgi:hypothetical protein